MKKSNRKVDIIIVIVIVLLIIAAVLASLIPKSDGKGAVLEKDVSELTIADLADKNIGVVTGSLFETFVKDNYPEAAISFYNSVPDLTMALNAMADMIDSPATNIGSRYRADILPQIPIS